MSFGMFNAVSVSDTQSKSSGLDDIRRSYPDAHQPLKMFVRKDAISFRTMLVLLLDIMLLLVPIGLYGTSQFLRYMHDTYWEPQLSALFLYQDNRITTQNTYYDRICDDASDLSLSYLSTLNANELWLPPTATGAEAAEHQMIHGFTIIEQVMTPSTVAKLREHVNEKNYAEESLFVIEQENRFSVLLGTDEPIVAQALEEIANHPQFAAAIESVLGEDPALVELTAISSKYGAVDQYWHEDTDYSASANKNVLSFGSSYSIFMYLQDTTEDMGVTHACPGSSYCTDGPIAALCTEYGFPAVRDQPPGTSATTNSTKYFRAGDAMLMNNDSSHRGSAFTDPNAPDRIMFILTFSPKPRYRAESRQMARGLTYQNRWDMWGHTFNDMKTATKTMQQPWVALKSLGIYKSPQSSWGVDYIRASSQRMVNRDNGFDRDAYETLKEKGGLLLIPKFLQAFNGKRFYDFLNETHKLCDQFLFLVCIVSVALYVMLMAVSSSFAGMTDGLKKVIGVALLVGFLFWQAKEVVDSTGWAIDTIKGRNFASIVRYEEFYHQLEEKMNFEASMKAMRSNTSLLLEAKDCPTKLPTTAPLRNDILLETRYGSRHLGSHTKFMNYHTGNQKFQNLMNTFRANFGFNASTSPFLAASAEFIVNTVIHEDGSRFLYQYPNGAWGRMSFYHALMHTLNELIIQSSSIAAFVRDEIRFITSDSKFGIHRDTSMVKRHIVPYLISLRHKIIPTVLKVLEDKSDNKIPRRFGQGLSMSRRAQNETFVSTTARIFGRANRFFSLPNPKPPSEPFPGAWLEEGDDAEVFYEDESLWLYAKITNVTAGGNYRIRYPDGLEDEADTYSIRSFQPYKEGEKVEVFLTNPGYKPNGTTGSNKKKDADEDEYYEGDDDDDEDELREFMFQTCTFVGPSNMTGKFQAILDVNSQLLDGVDYQNLGRLGEQERFAPDRFAVGGVSHQYRST